VALKDGLVPLPLSPVEPPVLSAPAAAGSPALLPPDCCLK
jgi:hypothetical protein